MKGEMKITPGKSLGPVYTAETQPGDMIQSGDGTIFIATGHTVHEDTIEKKPKQKYDKLTSLTSSYFQEGDTVSTGDQQLELSTEDGGGGTYFVLKTDRWAFDSLEELSDLIQDFINTQKTIENGNH